MRADRLADRASESQSKELQTFGDEIADLYERREFGRAVREIMALADLANQYIDDKAPWVIAKEEGRDAELHAVCSLGINLFRVLIAYLADHPDPPLAAAVTSRYSVC